jgi:hypothetical protein
MYWYRLYDNKKVYFIADLDVPEDPRLYFGSDNIVEWGHKRDNNFSVDMLYNNIEKKIEFEWDEDD